MSSESTNRRARFATLSAVLLTAATASLVLVNSIAARVHTRYDVTATREHSLAPRTREILRTIDSPHRVVVSVDSTALDPRSRERITDLLDEFREASDQIEVVEIDTSSPASIDTFSQLLSELAARDGAEIEEQRRILEKAANSTESLASKIGAMDERIKEIRDAYETSDKRHTELNRLAGIVRSLEPKLREASAAAREAAGKRFAGVNIPQTTDIAERVTPVLYDAATVYLTAVQYADVLIGAETRPEVTTALRTLAREAEGPRDATLLALGAIDSLQQLDILDIARAIQSSDTVLVMNKARTTAIDFRSLFPPTALLDATNGGGAEITFAGEELIASAINSINSTRNPIIVFTHGEATRIFDESGKPTVSAQRSFGSLLGKLRLRGFGMLEWHTATEERPPSTEALDPSGDRPVVYFVFGPPSVSGSPDARGSAQAQRALRLGALTLAVEELVRGGKPMLVSLGLSELASLGQPDPLAEPLELLGLRVRSDLMLLVAPKDTSGQRRFFSEHRLPRAASDHPISEAFDGLAVAMPSPMPVELLDTEGVETMPLLAMDDSDTVYAESEWAGTLPYPVSQQPMPVSVPPTLSPTRDQLEPATGDRWIVGAASRDESTGQRAVVIASHVWFADAMTVRQTQVEGRNIWINPGNNELLESSLYWLAGLDEMIAQSPQTLDIPRIKPLDSTQIAMIRWTLIVVLPTLTLVIGVAFRVLRP